MFLVPGCAATAEGSVRPIWNVRGQQELTVGTPLKLRPESTSVTSTSPVAPAVSRSKRKRHQYSDTLVAFLKDLEQNGWKLAHEGIIFEKSKYRCTHCVKSGDIYEVFDNHINTNSHARARRK